jgi:valyl-tRNA synthetase
MIDKTYLPSEVEGRIYKKWEEAGAFRAGRPERAQAAPYSIVIPPPNVTGSLHMGHALNNTLQDILARFERMRGKDVLWQPGTDHAGIATQMVVERQLMERQEKSRRDMGRTEFLKRVWAWKEESGGTIINQLKRLGASCDWSRERFTMGKRGEPDDQMVKAVMKAFVDLYNTTLPDGSRLIYKDKRLVNWDPKLLTAISDLEVVPVETKGSLWHLRYPIEGKTFNPEDPSSFIVVATTRPETMLGDTAVAVHPDDERYKEYVNAFKAGRPINAILPLVGRKIPIIADEYSDPEKGSGAVKITPAHDFNDFEVGKRHNLAQINILTREARLTFQGNFEFLAGIANSPDTVETLEALDRKHLDEARKIIVPLLENKGYVEKIEPQTHAVPHGDRSNAVIQPFLTNQWYVDAKKLAEPAIKAVSDGETKFVPENWVNTYFNWMENIQPWCISRQLWWGHQIPGWYGRKEVGPNQWASIFDDPEIFVATTEDEAVQLARQKYGCDIRVLARPPVDELDPVFQQIIDEELDGKARWEPIWRDEDVLDTWFSSALWPFSTLGWQDDTKEL